MRTNNSIKEKSKQNNFFRASGADFKKIPGSPLAYWVSDKFRESFMQAQNIQSFAAVKHGLSTGKNEAVVRYWPEVSFSDFCEKYLNREEAIKSLTKWFPYNKGGSFRKWFGNCDFILRYDNFGQELMNSFSGHRHDGKSHYFMEGVTWTFISSSNFAARYTPTGFIFDVSGSSLFVEEPKLITAFLCSGLCFYILKALNPTLNFQVGNLKDLPYYVAGLNRFKEKLISISTTAVSLSKSDWDSYETSWDFTGLPLLSPEQKTETIAKTYNNLRALWQEKTLEMQQLEEENNRIFIEAYGLENELTPDVPLKEITLTCNPYYRYGVDADGSVEKGDFPINQTIEDRLRSDSMKEFISYAVGCMFGRYSLDKDGLILANAGDGIEQYMTMVPEPSFRPDESGILPLTDADDFNDDLPTQLYRFLRITFGEEHYHENLRFIEDSIGKTVRQYFLKDFFKDHVQRYKKRPIYWLVTSPKGSFRAFIYLHRYTKDTVGQVLNDYVRPFEKKLESKIAGCRQIDSSAVAGTKEKIQAQRDVDHFEKALQEISEWDANVLRPLALKRVELDLDDGVKVNYAKLGDVLEKDVGLNG